MVHVEQKSLFWIRKKEIVYLWDHPSNEIDENMWISSKQSKKKIG